MELSALMGDRADRSSVTAWAVAFSTVFTLSGLMMAFGWGRLWNWITGWWTPGWGNLFTVAIATAALGVGAWFNHQTLKRAAERHTQGRLDARHDKLRAELAALLSASGRRRSEMEIFANRVTDLIAATQSIADRGKLMIGIRAALNETVGALYARIEGHVYAVGMLTNDVLILGRIGEIHAVLKSDLADYEIAMELATKPKDLVETARMNKRREARTATLASATEQLLTYCSDKFSAMD